MKATIVPYFDTKLYFLALSEKHLEAKPFITVVNSFVYGKRRIKQNYILFLKGKSP